MALSNCLGQWQNLGFWEACFVAITSTRGPSLGLRFGSYERQRDAPLRSPFKKELTMPNTVSAVNSSWPITLQSTHTSWWWVTVHHSESNGVVSPPFLLDTLQPSSPALTETFLDNLYWQASEDTIRWWGHFLDDHPLLIPPRKGHQDPLFYGNITTNSFTSPLFPMQRPGKVFITTY